MIISKLLTSLTNMKNDTSAMHSWGHQFKKIAIGSFYTPYRPLNLNQVNRKQLLRNNTFLELKI